MSLVVRSFFGLLIVLFSLIQASGMQDGDSVITWYESFFHVKKVIPVEKELEQSLALVTQAHEGGETAQEVRALTGTGLIHLTRTRNYELAMNFFLRALAIEDSLNLNEEQVFTYLAIARVFEEVGDFDRSAEFLEQAFKINDETRDINILVMLSNKLGQVNAERGKVEEAFENYELVLKYKDQLTPQVEAEALFNIAHLYTLQANYDEALKSHRQSLGIRRSIKDKINEALSLNDIGELYHLMSNDEKALANHTVALKIRKTLNDKSALAESYNNIGALYHQQKNYQRAVSNLLLGLDAGQDSQDQNQIGRSYDYLSQAYKELGDYRNALKYKELYQAIHDFIQHDKNERQLVATQYRYVLDKKESQIGKLEMDRIQQEREMEEQKQFRNFLFVLIALSLIIVVLVFYLYVLKRKSNNELQKANEQVNKQNLQLQQLNATKDKFFSILGHDLKGPLNSLTSFSGLLINHTDSLSKDEIRMLAQDLDKSLKNLFTLLENLLEWSRSQTGNIEFKPEPFDLTALLEQNKDLLKTQAQNKKITIENISKSEVTVHAHKHSINTVVRNLVSNAIKFTPEGGTVTLNAQRAKDEVMVSITDTGVGMDKEVIKKLFRIDAKHSTKGTADEKGTGLGLILCKEFIEKNGGNIGVESQPGNGSVFYFTLPVTVT